MEWIEIKRNKDGIASKECLNEIFNNELIVVREVVVHRNSVHYIALQKKEYKYMYRYIKTNDIYTHYLPIPKV